MAYKLGMVEITVLIIHPSDNCRPFYFKHSVYGSDNHLYHMTILSWRQFRNDSILGQNKYICLKEMMRNITKKPKC